MNGRVLQSDWKLFRDLRDLALERFSERVLTAVVGAAGNEGSTAHERYLEVYRIVRERDRELEAIFDGLRRSRMLEQLVAMRAHGLVSGRELERFSGEVRDYLDRIAALAE